MSIEDLVTELLLRWEDDPALSPEDLCREYQDHPEHAALLEAVRREMGALRAADAFLDTSKGDGSEAGPGAPEPSPRVAPAGTAPLPRYRPVAFHAKGGLGEVYRAEDEEPHREVALKRIREDHRGDAQQRRSFLREAEITAKLEHPGVVPVHGLQVDADGEPYYAMRFIRGESLDAAIKQFHEANRQPGRDPGERSLALRQLLSRFVAVCNTVAYAHSRGVLHRDLKPANIMLGAYGETLVVDWGLAKPFERTEAERATGEQTLQPPSAGAAAGTLPGVPKGTPAYMSPEQADGRWDELGPATDIFSLGATLYALLVGQPPFQGRTAQEALQRARRGEFPPPRQVRRDVPRALEAVCLKAMARKPEDRYATALGLPTDVERWLADEPVGAWREPVPARLGRWARRNKPQVAGVAAVVLTALLLGGFGISWWQWQRSVTAQAAMPDVQKAEDVLQQLLDPAEARQALDRADARLGGAGPADLRERIQRLRQDMAFVEELEQARLKAATWVDSGFDYRGADRAYADAFAKHDIDVMRLPPEEAAPHPGPSMS
jgi:tRNA A-37 threonylcarbamoyl transferase component Bud32